jgi:hypothetical protein
VPFLPLKSNFDSPYALHRIIRPEIDMPVPGVDLVGPLSCPALFHRHLLIAVADGDVVELAAAIDRRVDGLPEMSKASSTCFTSRPLATL